MLATERCSAWFGLLALVRPVCSQHQARSRWLAKAARNLYLHRREGTESMFLKLRGRSRSDDEAMFVRCVFRIVVACSLLGSSGLRLPADEPVSAPRASRSVLPGILFNEDDSHRFFLDPPGDMKPARLDSIVDKLAESHVTTMLICCCAKNTNFESKVWDVYGKGFDSDKDNDQPFFGDAPKSERDTHRRWAYNLKMMLDAGVDPTQRMIDRCRTRDISPWVSIRMNDAHDSGARTSPLHSRFWMEHPEFRFAGPNFNALNYGLKPVRDHMMELIREVCDRYDMDGLELDWIRFPMHFRRGEEIEGGKALTEWMVEVREVVRAAEKKWKHPILLMTRVPARPEVSMSMGLDAVTWARRGLIDHLIVAPFWATTDFDIPVEQWIALLKGTSVGVTAGLEYRVQPSPGGDVLHNSIECRRGAALAALARGSQGIYLFNYFIFINNRAEVSEQELLSRKESVALLKELDSIEVLAARDRSYVVTYPDIAIPGQPIQAVLPKNVASGQSAEFSLFIGPRPLASARGEVKLTLAPEKPGEKTAAEVQLNGQSALADAGYTFDPAAFREAYNVVRVTNAGTSAMTVKSVMLSVRFPSTGKTASPADGR